MEKNVAVYFEKTSGGRGDTWGEILLQNMRTLCKYNLLPCMLENIYIYWIYIYIYIYLQNSRK
jgi:hypothetical protein